MLTDRYITSWQSPLGPVTIASDGEALIGLWFDGQKYDRANLYSRTCQKKKFDFKKSETRTAGPRTAGPDNVGLIQSKSDEMGIKRVEANELPVFVQTIQWLETYFTGQIPSFTPPLKVEGSPFRQLVAEIMLTIPYGKTMTYGEIAKEAARRMGKDTMSAQAVGGAVGHNPISIIIPCHRVMGAGGSLTGYAGGIEKKKWMLELERRKR